MSRWPARWRRQKHSSRTAWRWLSLSEVREYFEEEGVDMDGMDPDALEEASEVFPLPDGKYLIVEG